MTYSHNSVRNNIKMTTASTTKSIRLKKGATTPAPAPVSPTSSIEGATTVATTPTPSETAHSNSIASSTNFINNNHHFHQQQVLSISPTLCSPTITPNNRTQQRLHSQSAGASNQRTRQQQQRQSPQQMSGGGGGGFFFANNCKRNGGNGGGRSPQQATTTLVRQSPATILGGGFSPTSGAGAGVLAGGSARKQRRSPTTTTAAATAGSVNSFGAGGKISPQQHLIPTALTHFAGSKCFDAPAPTALPKPPQHWTLTKSEEKLVSSSAGPTLQSLLRGERCSASKLHLNNSTGGGYVVKSSKRNLLDDFDTHNLKLLLNVQS
ncbi:hypothetical protein KR215_010625 [Drosophila sulfurigaster]|nr:hypothetical protein KR215_010625 [Drosophila sulfurigaster]